MNRLTVALIHAIKNINGYPVNTYVIPKFQNIGDTTWEKSREILFMAICFGLIRSHHQANWKMYGGSGH